VIPGTILLGFSIIPSLLAPGSLGAPVGLAIYNSHILEFSFPLVLYKKLTGVKPIFQDIQVGVRLSVVG